MKRISSVWMAAARNLWWKLLLIMVVLSAAEIGLYQYTVTWYWDPDKSLMYVPQSFSSIAEGAKLSLVFFAALLALTACCCLQGSRFSGKNLYTLQRLPLSEWQITLHWALVHLACFIILWAVQVVLIFVLWGFYAAEFSPASPGLDLLVSIYTTDLFHTVLPLADTSRFVYLITYWLCMAFLTATFGFFQRRGRYRISLLIMLACYFVLIKEIGSFASNILFTMFCLILAAVDAFALWGVYHETQPD